MMNEDIGWMARLLELQGSGLSEREIEERGSDMVEELIGRFRHLGYGQPAEAVSVDATLPSSEEIEKTVDEVLGRAFGNFGKERSGGR